MMSIYAANGPFQHSLRLDLVSNTTTLNEGTTPSNLQDDQDQLSSGSNHQSGIDSEEYQSDSSQADSNHSEDETSSSRTGQVPLEAIVLQGKKKVKGMTLTKFDDEEWDDEDMPKKKGKSSHQGKEETDSQLPSIQPQQLDLTHYHLSSNMSTPFSSLHSSPIHHSSNHSNQQQLLTHYFPIQQTYQESSLQSQIQSPSQSQSSQEQISSNGESLKNSSDQPKRKRGRPPKKKDPLPDSADSQSPQQRSPSKEHSSFGGSPSTGSPTASPRMNPPSSPSVRSIPCFHNNCIYSYKRPGSQIVEVSDRPLLVGSTTNSNGGSGSGSWSSPASKEKFEGYVHVIRACKKHHDRWKTAAGACEVCRGLNNPTPEQADTPVQAYTNNRGLTFYLCQTCAERQCEALALNLEQNANSNGSGNGSLSNLHHVRKLYLSTSTTTNSGGEEAQGSPRVRRKKNVISTDSEESEESGNNKEGDEGEDVNDIMTDESEGERNNQRVASLRSQKQETKRGELENAFDIQDTQHAVSQNNHVAAESTHNNNNGGGSREHLYLESFKEIQQFNDENLSQQENAISAFNWFLAEGHRVMKSKGKFTVPIENRLPSKKGMANNFTTTTTTPSISSASSSSSSSSPRLSSHSPNKRKNMAEWGYVAQLERLDLERGREDCWVTFKPAKRWDYVGFLKALQTWHSMHGVPSNYQELSPAELSAAASSSNNNNSNSNINNNNNTNSNNGPSSSNTPKVLAIQHKIISADPIKINSGSPSMNKGPSPLVERRQDQKKKREMLALLGSSQENNFSNSSSSSSSSSINSSNTTSSSSMTINDLQHDTQSQSQSQSLSNSQSSSPFPLLGVPFSENNKKKNPNDLLKCVLDEILFSELTLSFSGNLLGKSNHGYVFKAYWKGLPVAVRFPTLKYPITDPNMRDRWVREVNRATLSHPNIVPHYAASAGAIPLSNNNIPPTSSPMTAASLNSSTQLFVVMEYCNLGSLRQYWPIAPLYVQGMYIARIALDTARAMGHLHSLGKFHTNLKPSSVMLKGEMLEQGIIAGFEVKITDVGLYDLHSNSNGPSTDEPQITSSLENYAYMAPELLESSLPTPSSAAQANPYSHFNLLTKFQHFLGSSSSSSSSTRSFIKPSFSKQTDVYAFGMVLCFLFSEGQEVKPPAEVTQTSYYLQLWDSKWKELILKCTHKVPEERPSFPEILDTLTELQTRSRSL